MRATRLFALTVLASATVATGAAQAGEALYLTPPLFREQARETQQVRTLSDLTTTPQPVAPAKAATAPQSTLAGSEVETTGSF
ncbi:hypothetical protein ASG51_19990 [Methylobacterium sp. Leaf465]|uniref:hypothetical protein n=1 Tax=Methylobacterium sp. Leaf465 TaxID=1736385 RepID=UPI0006F2996A|nr:hypothetical protein [Methylobacterium sp. Leaf465]KQT82036.1 hypothetical protein ASG51_19990 [Methylobacterium sp. Leaf465]